MYGGNRNPSGGQPFDHGAQAGYVIGDIPPLPRASSAASNHQTYPQAAQTRVQSRPPVGGSNANGHIPPGAVEVTGSVAQTRSSSASSSHSKPPPSSSAQYKVSGPPNYVQGNSAYLDYYAQRPQYDHQNVNNVNPNVQKPVPGQRGPPPPLRGGSAGSMTNPSMGHANPNASSGYYQNQSPANNNGGYSQGRVPTPYMPAPRSENDLALRFREFDRNNTGRLDYDALKRGLRNGDDTPFDSDTVKVIMKMFDEDGDKAINFLEFKKLWSYLYDYREIFSKFDRDNSGDISINEFSRALHAFGYRLSSPCIQTIFLKYSVRKTGKRDPVVSFDRFVLCCIHLLNITTSFKRFDYNRDGFATIGFEDYLVEVTMLRN